MFPEVVAEISIEALLHNLAVLRSRCDARTRLCAPLKADAYGHGMACVAGVLDRTGVDLAGVANLDEGIRLRGLGWKRPILVFGNVLSVADAADRRERVAAALRYDLALTLADDAPLFELDDAARAAGRAIDLHLKFDSGMGRMGCAPDDALSVLQRLREMRGLRLAGVYSHFGMADLSDAAQTDEQVDAFRRLLQSASDLLPSGVTRHLANTAATLTRPDAHFDMVRPGIGLYGYDPRPAAQAAADAAELKPSLRLLSRIALCKQLPAGHCVGYGCTFRTARPTRLGIVPVGYHDGYVRALSNRAVVATASGDAPVVGRISMDQLAIDVTDLAGVSTGATVVLLDPVADRPNSVRSVATTLNTISYEVVCLLGRRIHRRLVDRFAPIVL